MKRPGITTLYDMTYVVISESENISFITADEKLFKNIGSDNLLIKYLAQITESS